MPSSKTIFILKNRALGDSIMGLSSVQYLRQLYPKANIIYAVPQWIAPLYQDVQTKSDMIYPLSLKNVRDVFNLFDDLMAMKVDHIHEMHQSGRGSKVFKMYSFIKGIPYTFHNHHLKSGTKVIDQGVIKSLIQRDLDGVHSFFGEGNPPSYLDWQPEILLNSHVKLNRIIFGVVATRKAKMWPLDHYVRLAKLIEKNFPDIKISIPLSHGKDDLLIKEDLMALDLPSNVSIVHLPLSELPQYFKESQLYIGNDTGLKHLAVAVGIKSFTLFGPEPATEWHPYDEKQHPYFYQQDLACRIRESHYCGLTVCDLKDDYMRCMKLFPPEVVYQAVESTCKGFRQSHDPLDQQLQ